jgi:CO/xanthine dehydrogenase FAD-binding subunit
MRSALSRLEVLRPRRLDEALEALSEAPAERRPAPLAGGTDVFVYLNAGTWTGSRFIDLGGLRELRGVRARRDGLEIGALATFRELGEHAVVRRRFPSLAAAAAEVGGWQIQSRATIAGNIANASPAGDSLPVLLAHDAVVRARSVRGGRDIPFTDFYRGYRVLALEPDEMITSVVLPFPPARATAQFRKVGTRRAQSISKVVFAGLVATDRAGRVAHARLAFGSVAPVPLRARAAEEALMGRAPSRAVAEAAMGALARDLAPIDDIRSTRDYRERVSRNLLALFLRAADARFAAAASR